MSFFVETVVGGLLAGVMYSLVAIGFVLIYKASGVFNFAQGSMVLCAGLTFVTLRDRGIDFWLAGLIKIDFVVRKSWCECNDPHFTAKAADVVGLYVAPPAKAIVLCVDEKPSTQALERAQGYLKLPNGRTLTGQSHDYKRHGTTTLFAALEVAPERSSRRIQNGGVVSSSSTS
ncbi:hypothetical protein ABIC08_005475 [Bradyrhizobium sp. RT9b]